MGPSFSFSDLVKGDRKMMSRWLPFVLLSISSTVSAAPGQSPDPGVSTPAVSGVSITLGQRAERMLQLINSERGRLGRAPLALQPQLLESARSHNLYQARRSGITHQGADGSWPWQRANRHGFAGPASENVGWSGRPGDSAISLHRVFMLSTGHRHNLLDARWRNAGIHFCWTRRGTYVCCVFGA